MSLLGNVFGHRKKASEDDFISHMFSTYKDEVYRYTYFKLRDRYEAEDAMSDAYEKLIKNRDDVEMYDEETRKKYLFGYAKVSCIDILRKRSCREKHRAKEVSDHQIPSGVKETEFADQDANIIEHILKIESMELIISSIQKLDKEEQRIVISKVYLRMKNTEIAEEMNMNPSTVGTRLSRIYKKLRKELEVYFNE